MKRRDLIRHLEAYSCQLLRESGNHFIYINRAAQKVSAVPRHREINDFIAQKICRDLQIPERYRNLSIDGLVASCSAINCARPSGKLALNSDF